MNVQELIEKLQTQPMDAPVKVWDAYYDRETYDVVVSKTSNGEIFILNIVIGEKL